MDRAGGGRDSWDGTEGGNGLARGGGGEKGGVHSFSRQLLLSSRGLSVSQLHTQLT